MRVAVITDIHANLHALDAVLAEIEAEAPDELWCLGDLVGYGPRPTECCERVRNSAAPSLVGNHDLAVIGEIDIDDFTPDAAAAATWSRGVLSPDMHDYLASLRPQGVAHGVELYHGSARDPIWEYVLDGWTALATLELTTADLVLVGHSHVALQIELRDGELAGGLAPAGTQLDLAGARWVLNPGSVGQPRDGDARAAWLLLDLEARRAEFRRTSYDLERTQREIREAGLPETLAARLATGQ